MFYSEIVPPNTATEHSIDVPACSLYALGMYTITWERTVIGGETAPGDFVAVAEGETVGRIYPYLVGPTKGYYWTFQLGYGEFRKAHLSGIVDTKQEAADKVKVEFARWLEYPHEKGGGKDLPFKYWSPGSIAYSKVKHK